jgi:hypothetical protein
MNIVENSYYSHDEYGNVRVLEVDDSVTFQTDEMKYISGVGDVPVVKEQDKDIFEVSAEPTDVDLNAPISDVGAELNNPN